MNRYSLSALLLLLGVAFPALGQFGSNRAPTPPVGGFGTYSPYGAFGGIFSPGPFGSAAIGPYGTAARYNTLTGPMGMPGGFGASGVGGNFAVAPAGAGANPGQPNDPNAGWTTGHPTRFFNYGRYFFNQGSTLAGGTGAAGGIGNAAAMYPYGDSGSGGALFMDANRYRPGGQPPRGRDNVPRGKR